MPRAAKPLNARRVETAPVGKYYDGDGLILWVRSPSHGFWVFRYRHSGRAREMGLGRARGRGAVPLAQARIQATKLRLAVLEGTDPLGEHGTAKARAVAKATATTFSDAANAYIAAHEAGWKSAKHGVQWRNTLAHYVLPTLGELPVGDIDTAKVLSVLKPVWTRMPESASRIRGRIESVLDYCTARGLRAGPNPAAWKNHLSNLLPKPSKLAKVAHHKAVDWREISTCMVELRKQSNISARALEFAILTATRSGETRMAVWSEIDINAGVWSIAGDRMKAGVAHRVPLSAAALAILREMEMLRSDNNPTALVFPGTRAGRPLGDVPLSAALARTGFEATVHGMRSTFRDWAAEATATPNHVVEQALAHSIGSAVEAAYRRGDLMEKRRRLMDDWGSYCGQPGRSGSVLPVGVGIVQA